MEMELETMTFLGPWYDTYYNKYFFYNNDARIII